MMKKVFIGLLVLFILVVGAVVAIPFIFKDTINELLKEQINNELKVSVDYSSYDLTILSSFPDFKFALNDLVVIGQNKFDGDTLALMNELNFNLDALKVFKENELQIHSIYINKLNLKAYILKDSTSSLDVLKDKPKTETTKIDTSSESLINMALESFIVEQANILYKDDLNNKVYLIKDLNIDAGADYINEEINLKGNTQISELILLTDSSNQNIKIKEIDIDLNEGKYFQKKLTFNADTKISAFSLNSKNSNQNLATKDLKLNFIGAFFENVLNVSTISNVSSLTFQKDETKYLSNAKLSLVGDVLANFNTSTYTFKENIFKINDLALAYDGFVKTPKSGIEMDIAFNTSKSSFKELFSIIPSKYLKNYKDINVKGKFDLSGYAKGFYSENSYPSFNIDLAIENGYLKNKLLPTAIEDINVNVNVKSPNSDMSKMDIVIPKSSLVLANEKIDFDLKMLDAKNNPFVDMNAKGKVDLQKIPDLYEIDGLKKLEGNVDMDISFKGKLSDVENKNFKNVDFQGDMKIQKLVYETKTTEMPIKVKTLDLVFTPQYAKMSNLDMKYGKSDIKANGKLENVINYVFSNGTIKGSLDLNSNKIDLTEMMGGDESSTENTNENNHNTESKATRVPKNVDFILNARINEVVYDDIILSNVNGKISLVDEAVNIKKVKANMLGGKAVINGKYATKKAGKPELNFKYDIKNFDIKQTFKYVNTVKSIAPIAEYLDGKFSTDFSFNSLLENNYMPDLDILNGLGNVNISYASFLNFPLFKSVSDAIKIPALDLSKADIRNAWTIFKIKNGKVEVEPFDYEYQDIKMNVFGANGFDKSIDYTMKITVPSDKFGSAASVANDWLSKQSIPLLNLSVPKNITFHLNLSGFLNNPKVKIIKVTSDGSDKGIVEQVTDTIKDKAKEEAEKLKKQAEERARKEAEKLRKEAEKRAKEEADKLLKDAEDKIKKEAGDKLEDLLKDNLPNFGF